ncbi:MAG: phenylalanine--tRNA ligase subunit beta, partial [Bdellovibrionales bacterium]|nr:phenylalanine--tRNA ligase subunit beta [Bdellovibrionales bacterium]
MKVSLNWIKDYVPLPDSLTPSQLSYDLTMTTVEVEGYEDLGAALDKIVIGKVVSLAKHPQADRLTLVQTDVGEAEPKEIVCGGDNLREGMLVAVAPPGSKVRWHGEGDLVELKETKIRGVKSFGMICASNEIGLAELFPLKSEKEIVDLSSLHVTPGTPIADALGLRDIIFEIDNKSLTNRPDLWGHYGIARELAAIYSLPLSPLPVPPNVDAIKKLGTKALRAQIQDTDLCTRYIGALIENVSVCESPNWLKSRLSSVGQRPIDLIVDLTNYVMFALGQPTHAFDAKNVSNTSITVRRAQEKEGLVLLDAKEIALTSNALVIADDKQSVALAGIMGGENSGVSPETTTLLLESANFEPVQVRHTATRYGLRTEGSMRWEKGIDSPRAEAGADLFFALLHQLQPSATVVEYLDVYPVQPESKSVSVSRD